MKYIINKSNEYKLLNNSPAYNAIVNISFSVFEYTKKINLKSMIQNQIACIQGVVHAFQLFINQFS